MPGIKLPLFFTGIALIAAGLANACNPNPADFFDQGRTSLTLELPENIESYSAEDCRACHPEDYEDWNDSMHARAFVDPIFQSAFRKEPAIWCVNCHAPLSQQAFTQTSGPYVVLEAEALEANDMQLNSASQRIQLRNEGINCAACHVRNGKILSSRPEYGPLEDTTPDGTVAVSKEGRAPHPTVYEPRLSTAEFCAGCHQFNFPFNDPAAIVHYGDEPMQNVYAEWSQHAGRKSISCQACHMSRDHHRLYGPHSPGWLSDRIQMHARMVETALGNVVVQCHLVLHGIGHNFPTGDLFRRVRIQIVINDQVLVEKSFGRRILDRRHADAPGGFYKYVSEDTSLTPNEDLKIDHEFQLILPRSPALQQRQNLNYRVLYEYQNASAAHAIGCNEKNASNCLRVEDMFILIASGPVAMPRITDPRSHE